MRKPAAFRCSSLAPAHLSARSRDTGLARRRLSVRCELADAEAPDAGELPGQCLFEIANEEDDPDRIAFSEYHASKSPSASFMIRKGRYKYTHYIGFEAELFDLESDPDEEHNLAADPLYVDVVRDYEAAMRAMIDPEEIDRQANAAQKEMIEKARRPRASLCQSCDDKELYAGAGCDRRRAPRRSGIRCWKIASSC